MATIEKALISAIKRLRHSFDREELAYLAITSKTEGPIRDRLAYLLHRALEKKGYLVGREWKRIDLAILNANSRPIAFVELKMMYSFDPLMTGPKYTKLTNNDERKAFDTAAKLSNGKDVLVYSLLVSAHLQCSIPRQLATVTKYSSAHNRFFSKQSSATVLRRKANQIVTDALVDRAIAYKGSLPRGEAFGIKVSFDLWLVRGSKKALAS